MPTDLNQEWDGPIEIPDVIITQHPRESPNADIIYIGPITRRHSTIDSLPQENTCLCGDCLCCCMRLCPWCF